MRELFAGGGRNYTLVVERLSSQERMRQGWAFGLDELCRNHTVVKPTRSWIDRAIGQENSLHLVSGLAAFETGRHVVRAGLKRTANVGVMSEAPDLRGARGILRVMYNVAFERSAIRSLNPILAIGPQAVQWFRASGAPEGRVFEFCYTTSPAQPDMFGCTNPAISGRLKIVFVGRIVPLKNLGVLVRAMDLCGSQQFELTVVGDGPERAGMQRAVSTTDQADVIQFLGALPSSEARRTMAKADVLVLPSLYDGWGAVVNEALQEGVYCVVSSACGAKSLLQDERLGKVFDPEDPGELARILMETLERKLLGQLDRVHIRNWAATRLSGRSVADYFSRVVEFACSGGDVERPLPPWCAGENRQYGY